MLDLKNARQTSKKLAMLTCYDYTTARLMHEAGVRILLVGDSAANVILGYENTIPVSLAFMIELTAAVRRGAPLAFVIADMPFGSYQPSVSTGVKNVCRMMKLTGCDCVKLELAGGHLKLVRRLAQAGVAVMAHIGLRPQTLNILGGYRYQGRSADEASDIVGLAVQMQEAGAASILLEAVPPEVSAAVVEHTTIPIIGCGAGPACHGHVVVTQDALGLTPRRPRFVPLLADLGKGMKQAFADYVGRIESGEYPAAEQQYEMSPEEKVKFKDKMNKLTAL